MGLKESDGYACPECGQDNHIFIQCDSAWSKLVSVDGDDIEWEDFEGHEYDGSNSASCDDCNWGGQVCDLTKWKRGSDDE